MNASDIEVRLGELLGPDIVSTDPRDLESHAHDWSPRALLAARAGDARDLPICVVRPRSTEQCAVLLRWAHETATPVVPFGAGSDVVQGISPGGAVVVDMRSMNSIRNVDAKSRLVTVEAGIMGPDLAEHLAAEGFTLGHEPQSFAISTVGGWVATRACGQLSAGYGGIEDLVAGIEAVLPGGSCVTSKVVPRRSAGPDVASLMVGSEGTLGIVTAVTLRISPLPGARADRCLRYEHMADGVAGARAIAQSELRPSVLRLYDAEDAMLFLRHHPDEPQGPLMVMSFFGEDAEARASSACELAGGHRGNDALVEHWWHHRNDAVGEFRKLMDGEGLLGPHGVVDTIEVSGTWSVLRDLYHSIKEGLSARADIAGCHLSHIYPDGACLYFTCGAVASSDEEAASKLDEWWATAMRSALDNGGSISHHHGIGRTKAEWLPEELGGWWEVLRLVKSAIDPKGIMNPGALGL